MARSIIDQDPITYHEFISGAQYAPEVVVARLTPPSKPNVRAFTPIYLVRVPNPHAAGPTAPDAFNILRLNYNGVEYMNPHEARYLYDRDKPVWLIRRALPAYGRAPKTTPFQPPRKDGSA